MIDALMAVWNRRHRGHGIKLILALLLIAISMALVLTTFGINTNNSIADHVTGTPRHTGATATAAATTTTPAATTKTGEVISIKTVTPTVVLKKKPMTQPCVAKTAKWSTGPFNGVSGNKKHKATPTARPRPSPTPAISPTVEPTNVPVEPTATEEDTPTPSPTEEITPVTSPTAVSTLPPEPTIVVLITPTVVAIETSTSEATAISGDATTTPTPDLDDEKASLAAHVLHQPTEKPGSTTIVRGSANCLRNSVDRPVDGMQGLAVNLVIVLGSILPGILLFYGALCAVYMLRQRGARGKQQDVKWE